VSDFMPLTMESWARHEAREHARILAHVEREVADLAPADRAAILAAVRREMAHQSDLNLARVAKALRAAH